jgi:hypothetical protein
LFVAVCAAKPVSFRVFLTEPIWTSSITYLVFKGVDINVGNGYNPLTGKFQAPASGLYAFSICVSPVAHCSASKAALMISDKKYICHMESSDLPCCAQTVHHMKAGDSVWVETYPDESSFDAGYRNSFFTGFLVYPD